jgi:pyridoxine/pyridoxamine 5'-phosphate oxidase
MMKSAAIIKEKTLAPWRELRLQKRKAKKIAMLERKAIKQYYPSRIDAPIIDVDAAPQDDAPPTRAELEAKATELGIKFDGRTKDKKLGQLIQDRLFTGD